MKSDKPMDRCCPPEWKIILNNHPINIHWTIDEIKLLIEMDFWRKSSKISLSQMFIRFCQECNCTKDEIDCWIFYQYMTKPENENVSLNDLLNVWNRIVREEEIMKTYSTYLKDIHKFEIDELNSQQNNSLNNYQGDGICEQSDSNNGSNGFLNESNVDQMYNQNIQNVQMNQINNLPNIHQLQNMQNIQQMQMYQNIPNVQNIPNFGTYPNMQNIQNIPNMMFPNYQNIQSFYDPSFQHKVFSLQTNQNYPTYQVLYYTPVLMNQQMNQMFMNNHMNQNINNNANNMIQTNVQSQQINQITSANDFMNALRGHHQQHQQMRNANQQEYERVNRLVEQIDQMTKKMSISVDEFIWMMNTILEIYQSNYLTENVKESLVNLYQCHTDQFEKCCNGEWKEINVNLIPCKPINS